MGYFQLRYDSRVVIYKCKMFIRLATVQVKTSHTVDLKGGNELERLRDIKALVPSLSR